jgi:nanoRNase/pAp phosphatase (c-di-AMP/oligoRNAs hydrolase)
MKANQTIPEIASLIVSSRRVLVASHVNPDPDAYGSSCGLMLGLRALGKEVACVNDSGIVPKYTFIPGVSEVVSDIPPGGVGSCYLLRLWRCETTRRSPRAVTRREPVPSEYRSSYFKRALRL